MKKTIIVVDDDQLNRKILENILSRDYEVIEAANGKEAFEVLEGKQGKIAGIMLDLIMPVMSGYEFLEKMGDREKYQNIPVIVSTGNGDRENEKKALQLGAWDFISKPYDADIIKFRLKNAISRSQMAVLKRLKYDAEYDALTGLYNKSTFLRETVNMVRENEQENFALVRFDINRFSVLNSYYGTPEGDQLLKKVAGWMKQQGESCRFFTCGRMEADEFAFCMNYQKKEDIVTAVNGANQKISRFNINFHIVLSFGVYLVEDRNVSAEAMLDHARLAAKQIKGKFINNYAFYTVDMGKALEHEQKIVNEMADALEEEQFVVYLQPKYNLKTNKPEGAEALIRWNHPEEGMISPGFFIPVFERNGFIERLDYYVWEKVCALLQKWIAQGLNPCPISVNLSRINTYNPRLAELICGLTAKYGIPNELLQLELTESAYTDNQAMIQETMDKLHRRGFTILMDDFGSGYSSLNILKDLDVDILKIDMGFMTGGKRPGRGESIISSVVRMAKWLNIPVVAEGVEKLEQVKFLREIGCEYVQGYYFAKPMPTEQYEILVQKDEVFIPEKNDNFYADKLWEITPEMDQLFSSVLQAVGVYEIEDGKPDCMERVRVNNAFYELFGYEDMATFSKNPILSLKEEFRKPLMQTMQEVINTADVGEMECIRTCMNGKDMWVHVKMKYVNQVGSRHVLVCSFFDITEQKELDQELQKYRSVLASGKKKTNRILIVDDVEFNRDLLYDIFEDKYELIMAENGLQALDKLTEMGNHVDLILLDMMMPVMNGTQFLEYRRKHGELAGIPVIIITSDDSPEQQINTLALGANDYITKPFVSEIVVRRVDNVLESQMRFKEILKQYNKELQRGQIDELTGLYNRESAENIINELLDSESDRMHAFMLIDINRFRSVNTQYGSGGGDRALQRVGEILRRYFRSNDIMARLEGDQFCVFMTAVPSREMVVNKCNQLCDKVKNASVDGITSSLSVSIGVSVTDKEDTSFAQVYERAKQALKKAKEGGGGKTVMFP